MSLEAAVFTLVRSSAVVAAWIATYAVHSTVAILAAAVLARLLDRKHERHALRETTWKVALLAGLVTASVHAAFQIPTLGGSHDMSREVERMVWPAPPGFSARTDAAGRPAMISHAADAVRLLPAVLVLVWVSYAVMTCSRLLTATRRARAAIGPREPVSDAETLADFSEVRRGLRLTRDVLLSSAPALTTPVALGRREICIPSRIQTDLGIAERRSVLAHEVAHLVRHDPAWLLLAATLESLFFFQPLNRWARAQILHEAEFLADEMAARETGDSLSLARGLALVAEWRATASARLLAPALGESRSSLLRRVARLTASHDIITGRTPTLARWSIALLPASLALVAAPVVSAGAVRAWGVPAFHWSGTVVPGEGVEIDGVMGSIEAEEWAHDSVAVYATRHGSPSAPAIRFETVRHAGGVTVCALEDAPEGAAPSRCEPGLRASRASTPANNVVVEFLVKVPPRVRFAGRTTLGDIVAGPMTGNASGTSVTGKVRIITAGTAEARSVTGDVDVRIGAAKWQDTLRFVSSTGNVRVRVPPAVSADIVARSGTGRVSSTIAGVQPARRSWSQPFRRRGSLGESAAGTPGSRGGVLILSTQTGNVHLGAAPAPAPRVAR